MKSLLKVNICRLRTALSSCVTPHKMKAQEMMEVFPISLKYLGIP